MHLPASRATVALVWCLVVAYTVVMVVYQRKIAEASVFRVHCEPLSRNTVQLST
ncbi:hypothetical protein SAMN05216368_103131 [Cryobacterium flavum]|uniref:Uncharacterized protein n=1 Tax=Cryobacterium flavum TaxID=1424659 RepID=A0A5E9GSB8_9MICO|nr:hypothetical protein SAMN05216368_103131 [Cryobacterium flavum]